MNLLTKQSYNLILVYHNYYGKKTQYKQHFNYNTIPCVDNFLDCIFVLTSSSGDMTVTVPAEMFIHKKI